MTVLPLLPPAQYQAWQLLFELERTVSVPWALIGGQLVALLGKSAATAIAGRVDPERDLQDAALLLNRLGLG